MADGGDALVKLLEDKFGTDNLGNVNVKAAKSADGTEVFYVNAGINTSGIVLKTATAEARASLVHTLKSNGFQVEQVDFHILETEASASLGPAYVGAGASVNLVKGEVSIFNATLGLGVDSGVGIKDESLTLKLLGTGVTVGRKLEIAVGGSSFGIDLGKLVDLFHW